MISLLLSITGGRGKDVARPSQVNVNVATWSRMFMKKLTESQGTVSSPSQHSTPGTQLFFSNVLRTFFVGRFVNVFENVFKTINVTQRRCCKMKCFSDVLE